MTKQFPRRRFHPLTEDQIRARAYELWEARGGVGGSPEQDWQIATEELNIEKLPIRKLKRFFQAAFNENNRAFSLDVFKTLISTLGLAATVFAGVGLYLTYRNGQDQQRTAQQQQKLDSERLVTDRFSKAVEQLGSQNIDVRIGGIYSLERTANNSPEDYKTIMDVLAAFVRNKSPLIRETGKKKQQMFQIATDIQSALTVIGRRYSKGDIQGQPLNLMNTNLSGTFLNSANLKGGNFRGANLQGAQLAGANLQGAQLIGANLQGAQLIGVNLQHSNLKRVNMEKAEVSGTNLQEADFEEANLKNASLWNSKLKGANFKRANLQETDFNGADFQGVFLERANLKGANLEGVNLLSAYFDPATTQINQSKLCRTIISAGKVMNRDCKALGLPD